MTRGRTRLLVALTALGLLAPTAAHGAEGYDVRDRVADADDPSPEVRFEGAGWGHGVGMSQYGAYARARDGQSAYEILTTYYPGTTLPEKNTSRGIKVGLRQDLSCVDVTPDGGSVDWELTRGTSGGWPEELTQPDGQTWYVKKTSNGGMRVQDEACGATDRNDLASYGEESDGDAPVLALRHHGTTIETSDSGSPFTRGTHVIHRSAQGLTTVQHIRSLEEYLRGIAEVPDSWGNDGMAALQAQAIAARGYALRRQDNPRSLNGGCYCHLVNSTSDQVYRGPDRGPHWIDAVKSTAGKVLTYDGAIAHTFYSSSNGGRSENVANVWGSSIPYLVSIDDPYSQSAVNPYRSWRATAANQDVAKALDPDLARVERVAIQGRTAGGSPVAVAYRGRDGSGRQVSGTLEHDSSVAAGVTLRGSLSSGVDVDVVRADGSAGVNSLPSGQIRRMGFEPFRDDDGGVHEYATVWAHEVDVARGYENGTFRPGNVVTRAQMASFIHRTFDIPTSSKRHFSDVDPDGPHGRAVSSLAEAGIAHGWDDGTFRPGSSVTRAQMASFLVRAMGLEEVSPDGRFDDVSGGPHAGTIHAIADAGVTRGCDEDRYCPSAPVRRGQMTSFRYRVVESE